MLFLVQVVPLKRASIRVSLVIIFVVQAFEVIRVWFILFYFKLRGIDFKICFAITREVVVMFNFVWPIVFDTP